MGRGTPSDRAAETVSRLAVEATGAGVLRVALRGDWRLGQALPDPAEALRPDTRRIAFDASGLTEWDSGLVSFLTRLSEAAKAAGAEIDPAGLPEGARRLVALALAVPPRADRREAPRENVFARVGGKVLDFQRGSKEALAFIGEATAAFGRFVRGKAVFRKADFSLLLRECGAGALPIVSLICLLVGLILAFVAAIQLKQFGAQISVADVVGIGMVRVMGAIMLGIIMAGRTGAAFAAQLGTMEVNEEIDALRTMGVPPAEFLVLPRMLALIVMMPLLCLYADLLGIIGGMAVGVTMLGLGIGEYWTETVKAIDLTNIGIGLVHATVFGVLIALAGCLRGLQCGRSASAVGQATTSAVVTSIVSIILATAVITFLCQVLGV